MTVTLNVNGTDYFYPETGDVNWGPEATDWASAVTSGMLQKAGGLFVLLSDVDFGGSFGLKSIYFKSRTAIPSSTGVVRLSNLDTMSWRNFADSGDLALSVNSSDQLVFNGSAIGVVTSIADTNSIDLDITTKVLTANLKLSSAAADASNQLVSLDIQSDGLRAEITNARIVAGASGTYMSSLTGDVTGTGPGATATTIANGAVSLAKMANLAANSIIGNNTGSPAAPLALTVTQTTAMLNAFVGDSGSGGTKGLVPAPASGDAANFLAGDGTWSSVPAAKSSPLDSQNYALSASVATSAMTINLLNQSGSTPSGGNSCTFSFRSSTSASGVYTTVNVTSALSLVISSGSTLGQANAVAGYLYLYALNNAGTAELAISSTQFSDYSVVSTTAEGGAGAADSFNVIYSTTARSNVPIRLIGRFLQTQTTAGTWASTPTEIAVGQKFINTIEYGSNSGMGDSNDTTNFVSGALGSLIPTVNYSATRTKRIQFSAPVQQQTYLVFQIDLDGTGKWVNWVGLTASTDGGSLTQQTFEQQGSFVFGMGTIMEVSGSRTQFDVSFAPYRCRSSASYAASGANWAASSARWRVMKIN